MHFETEKIENDTNANSLRVKENVSLLKPITKEIEQQQIRYIAYTLKTY